LAPGKGFYLVKNVLRHGRENPQENVSKKYVVLAPGHPSGKQMSDVQPYASARIEQIIDPFSYLL
jgi:hypothetical protein